MAKLPRALVLASFCVAAAIAHAADVSGTWTASFDTQVGTQNYTFMFEVEGDALTGTAQSNLIGDSTLSDGKIDGDKISFVERGTYQGMPLEFNYSGEIVGDEIRFKRELMGFPAEEFVATRAE